MDFVSDFRGTAAWIDQFELHRWADDGGPEPDCEGVRRLRRFIDRSTALAHGKARTAESEKAYSLNCKAALVNKPVYRTLANHQLTEEDWDYQGLSSMLGTWFGRFNERFCLNLPQVPLRLDPRIRKNCAGYILPDHNEFGLAFEIAIAAPQVTALSEVQLGELLGTLLHEQLHLYQELTGVPGRNNYHNAAYRRAPDRLGLVVDYRGHQGYAPESQFLDFLDEFNIERPSSAHTRDAVNGQVPTLRQKSAPASSRSKLRKWSCGCTNVWVAVSELTARCGRADCGRPFARS